MNIDLVDSQKVSLLLNGYIRKIQSKINITYIPTDILFVIQQYMDIIKETKSIDNIEAVGFHGSCIITLKNKQYLFIFGGETDNYMYSNTSHLINLEQPC